MIIVDQEVLEINFCCFLESFIGSRYKDDKLMLRKMSTIFDTAVQPLPSVCKVRLTCTLHTSAPTINNSGKYGC